MRRNNLSRRSKSLPFEKRIIALSSFVALISCFLPWYGINSRVINEWWNAFGSIGSVAGYIVASFAVVMIALIVLPLIKPEFDIAQKLPLKESSLFLFLSAQSFFVTVIFIPVYAQYSLINATSSGTRFGLYVALIATLASSVFALSYHKRLSESNDRQPEFAKVPRTQRSVNYWQREDENGQEIEEEEEEFQQEAMFEESPEEGENFEEASLPDSPLAETDISETGISEAPVAEQNVSVPLQGSVMAPRSEGDSEREGEEPDQIGML